MAGLAARDDTKLSRMSWLIQFLFLLKATPDRDQAASVWNLRVVPRFNSLSYANLADWLQRSPQGQYLKAKMDAAHLGDYLACDLPKVNDLVAKWRDGGGSKTLTCICYGTTCCSKEESCPNLKLKRLERSPGPGGQGNVNLRRRASQESVIGARANDYRWSAVWNGVTYSGTYTAIDVR